MSDVPRRRLRELAEVPVIRLRHVGEQRAAALGALGVTTVFDLVSYYPRTYDDRTKRAPLDELVVGDSVGVVLDVTSVRARRTRQGRSLVEVVAGDGESELRVTFFNQPYRERQLVPGVRASFFGTVSDYRGAWQMTNPVVDVLVDAHAAERRRTRSGRFVPVYSTSAESRLSSWELGGFIEESLARSGYLIDPLDEGRRDALGLIDRTAAYWRIHGPGELGEAESARRRLVFDEFLRLQLLICARRADFRARARGESYRLNVHDLDVSPGATVADDDALVTRFLARHPFTLTGAQRRVLREIYGDLSSDLPMNRLLQGDVGSGKTMVALVGLLALVERGAQGALLAPTEVLAEQHLAALRRDTTGLRVADSRVLGASRELTVALLTGATRARERAAILEGVREGSIDILVGTHSLLSSEVRFRQLGLIVIDEQHRFGVEQRSLLREQGRERSTSGVDPDVLVMTATPIPRSAAMMIVGDLDVSVIDELPGGRQPIVTTWARGEAAVAECWQHVRREVADGRRVFVVCPLVEESESVAATGAVAERTRLALDELRGLAVGLLHGQMKAREKDEVMAAFRSGEINVLVATVVIEVGVDVPEASVMVIEDAWRFGLAQLHQLRGRVGRGSAPSYCYLLGEAPNDESLARLEAVVSTSDGFALAELDLRQRGMGTLLGTRQRGRHDLALADLASDGDLLDAARELAEEIVGSGDAAYGELRDEMDLFIDPDEAQYLFKS